MRRLCCWLFVVGWGCTSGTTQRSTGGASSLGGAPGSGGTASTGGATSSGGAISTGGASNSTGGRSSTGGAVATGGASSLGGASATGGAPSTGGASSLGASARGGASSLGGTSARGGASPQGGASARGGAPSTGGASSLGGASARGGALATGGASSQGGAPSTGGASGTVGATSAATPFDGLARTLGPLTLNGVANASGITWKPETDTFFIVANITHLLYEYSADFKTRLRTVSLDDGPTDTEDVVYLGANRFAVVVEDNEVYVLSIADGATTASMSAADVERYVVTAPPATTNRGFEGVTFRPGVGPAGQFIVCQEGGVAGVPIRVLSFERRTSAGTASYASGTLVVKEPWNALDKLDAVATDLSAVCFDTSSSTLLVLSQESSRLLRVAPDTGAILDQRTLSGSPQYEGVTLADNDRLVLVSEPNYVEVFQPK